MHRKFPERASAVFVCRSDKHLHEIGAAVQLQYTLPNFHYDDHSTWEYGTSMGDNIGFNITKTQGFDTIQDWMPNVPPSVNYQIILFFNHAHVVQRASIWQTETALIRIVHQHLNNVFLAPVRQIYPSPLYRRIPSVIKRLLRSQT